MLWSLFFSSSSPFASFLALSYSSFAKDTLNFPLFEEDWGADEELLLLEGIEMYGLGNWGDVSDHIGTKAAAESKEHYFRVYINVPTAPLPVLLLVFAANSNIVKDLTKVLTTSESLQQRN